MIKMILGRKIGMTQVWDDDDNVVPVTVIQAGPCAVSQLKPRQPMATMPSRSVSATSRPRT